METLALQQAHVQEKRMYTLLNETLDLSKQLAEAVDRGDQVATRMSLSMRGEPLEKLRQVRRALEVQRDALEPEDAARLAALLNGAAAEREEEKALTEQVALNRRLLERVLALDEAINRKLGRGQSIYESAD